MTTAPNGLERISPKTREQDPKHWAACVKIIKDIIEQHQPKVVLCPHDRDWNSTHIGTHYLVMDALKQMPASYECHVVETEFWGAMTDPNLMVEISAEDLADMIAATTFHVGEVNRNPYHLLLPPWMMDNVRRGGEVAGGQGGAAPDYTFAVLYRLRKWSKGQVTKIVRGRQTGAPLNERRRTLCMNGKFMREAIRLSIQMMRRGKGGPFGAVVVRKGKVVGRGSNQVTSANDPTAHAEIVAIRAACQRLKTFQLDDCDLYTSCEPCPMCLSAIYWARLGNVYLRQHPPGRREDRFRR